MAIYIKTPKPRTLVGKIRSLIELDENETWEMDEDGDFTLRATKLRYVAWIHPRVEEGRVVFCVLGSFANTLSDAQYATYMSSFSEFLIRYCAAYFSYIRISAAPSRVYDKIE